MIRKLLSLFVYTGLITIAAQSALSAGDESKKEPKITMKRDGDDIVASIEVVANNSPHALWAKYDIKGNDVILHYTLIQNSDRFVRSQKKVTVAWRLKSFAVLPSPPFTYRVEGNYLTPNTQQLKELTGQMQLLTAGREQQTDVIGCDLYIK